MLIHLLIFGVGVAFLFGGADWLVRGSSNLARYFRVHPLVVGLTVVAFGTSAPELVVSLVAALRGNPDIALGNVVGSNIANAGLVLGLAAVVRPLAVGRKTLLQEVPIMVAAQLAFLLLAWYGSDVSRVDGLILLAGMVAFSSLMLHRTIDDRASSLLRGPCDKGSPWKCLFKNTFFVGTGIIGLVFGSNLMIDSGEALARAAGVSEWVIGATLIAVGTSLPELATSLVAAYRRETDICIGNVVGSNIFNVLLILGTVATVRPLAVPESVLHFELPAMFLLCLLLWPIMVTGRRVSRLEGILLLFLYSLFISRLI